MTAAACPACSSIDTQRAEIVWDARGSSTPDIATRVAPPVPRAASTHTARFYGFGVLGLIAWVGAAIYLTSFVAGRAASVFFVLLVAVGGGWLQIVRLFTGAPKPSADQNAALQEWRVAHREWQRTWLCLRCGTTFVPRADDVPEQNA